MSRQAWAYIWSVLLAGVVLGAHSLLTLEQKQEPLLSFAVLTTLATLSQLFKALFKSRQQSDAGTTTYSPTLVFLFAGVLLLPPGLFTLLVIIPHAIEWARERLVKSANLRAWYIQPFNIATHIVSGIAASGLYGALVKGDISGLAPSPVFAVTAGAFVYVGMNHILVGQALVLARKVSWRETGTLEPENILSDFIMLCLGYAAAELWKMDHWLILPALSPLVLIYRALMVPQLKKDAQTDPKTGLLNARYFAQLVNTEIERAERFTRPLTLIMADLDLLRNINNTYGHLAGDVVLAGIGKIIRETIREYDIAARFGGEEFAIVLPEVGAIEAQALAERLRMAVEAARFEVETSPTPISATLSLGVACFPGDGTTLTALTHEADVAVYQAKLQGRNRVIFAADVPHFVKLQSGEGSESTQYAMAFASRIAHAGSGYTGTGGPRGTPARVEPQPVKPVAEQPVRPETQPAQDRDEPGDTLQPEKPGTTVAAAPAKRGPMSAMLRLYVGTVVALGASVALLGIGWKPEPDWLGVALLAVLAALVELLRINVYGANTVSVSVAFAFAAALVGGIPGAVLVSAALSLAHFVSARPQLYRTAFNWSTHLLAGAAVVLIHNTFMIPLTLENLLLLAVPGVLGSLAYYAIDTGLIAAAISLSGGGDLLSTWQRQFRWLGAHYFVLCIMGLFLAVASTALGPLGVVVFTLPVLMMRYAQQQYVEQTRMSMQELKRMNEQLAEANHEIVGASQAIKQFNDDLFMTLASILDARDPYVGGHAAQVARYATALAVEMGLPAERVTRVRQAAFLHDIGKIAISEQILHKPGKLTDEEYEYVKTHADKGAEILQMSKALRQLAPFVRHHHEYWNGKGYPGGLRGEDIPLEARLLSICDAVEAMASDRPYHKGMSLEEIIVELRRCAGTQFDPEIAELFASLAEREGSKLLVNVARDVDEPAGAMPQLLHAGSLWSPQGANAPAA